MRKVVWVDLWQLECCGALFARKDVVSWTVVTDPDLPVVRGAFGEEAPHVDLAEEHHTYSDDLPLIRGRVHSIRAVHARYRPDPRNPKSHVPVAGSGRLTPIRHADGVNHDTGDATLCGYLVEIDLIGRPPWPDDESRRPDAS